MDDRARHSPDELPMIVDSARREAWVLLPRDVGRMSSAEVGELVDRLVVRRREAEARGLAVRYRVG